MFGRRRARAQTTARGHPNVYKLIHREREAECVHPDAETRQTMRVKDEIVGRHTQQSRKKNVSGSEMN